MMTFILCMVISVVFSCASFLLGVKCGEKDTKQTLLDVMYEHEKAETQADRLDILRCAIRYVEELVWQKRR